MLITKYILNTSKHLSFIWKGLRIGWEICSKGTAWSIGHNSNIDIWTCNWIPDCEPLLQIRIRPLNKSDLLLTPKDLYHNDSWALDKISFDIPSSIANKIHSIIVPHSNFHDKIYWNQSSNGIFSTKSCYNLFDDSSNTPTGKNFDLIWSLNYSNKIKFFLWLYYHGRIPTRKYLHSIGINIDPICTCCRKKKEHRTYFSTL